MIELEAAKELKDLVLLSHYLLAECLPGLLLLSQMFLELGSVIMNITLVAIQVLICIY